MVGKRRGRGLGRWLALAVGVWFLVGSPLPSAEAGPVPAVDIATQESTAEGHEAQDLPEEVELSAKDLVGEALSLIVDCQENYKRNYSST